MNGVRKLKYILTLIWTFALTHMVVYVTSSMVEGGKYDFNTATILSVVITLLILVVSALIPNDPVQESGH